MANVWMEYVCFCRYFVSLSQVRYEHSYQKYPKPKWVWDIFIAVTVARTAGESPGSEGSAAGCRYSDPSEWQRSVCNAAAPTARRTPHHPNRTPGTIIPTLI